MRYNTQAEAAQAYRGHAATLAKHGIINPYAQAYVSSDIEYNNVAMDSQITPVTAANSGVPAWFLNIVDPQVYEILLAPNETTLMLGDEVQRGSWTTKTTQFIGVEKTGYSSSYGDDSDSGVSDVNTVFEPRQSYLFQTWKQLGDLEIATAAEAGINLVAQKEISCANTHDRFMNLSYTFGVAGLQCYGTLTDPGVAANGTLLPVTKASGNGNRWVYNGVINATSLEVFADLQALVQQSIIQSGGLLNTNSEFVLVVPSFVQIALTDTSTYNVNVMDMVKKNFPKLSIVTNVLYGAQSAENPFGNAAGNIVQLYAPTVGGQRSAYPAFSEKMRYHRVEYYSSRYRQKLTGGTWGAIIRQSFAISQLLGV